MKKFTFFLIIISLTCLPSKAQTDKKENLLTKSLQWAKRYLDKNCIEGYDTAYVGLPQNGFFGSVSTNLAGINTKVTGRGIMDFGDLDISMNSFLEGQGSVTLGYRGLLLSYTKDYRKEFKSDISFSWFERSWGVEYRHHSTDALHGKITLPALDKPIEVEKGDLNVKTTLLDVYLILNSRKFSYLAATSPTVIQKRSAGSFLIVGSYINATLETVSPDFIKKLDDVTEIDVVQGAIGFGYGYNYVINKGMILLHLSAIPTVVIHNNNLEGWNDTSQNEDGSTRTIPVLARIGANSKISFTSLFRCSANYNIGKRFIVRFDGKINNLRFSANTGLKVVSADWLCSLMFGVRF